MAYEPYQTVTFRAVPIRMGCNRQHQDDLKYVWAEINPHMPNAFFV